MPSGYPDWNTTLESRGIYSNDVNDLAARLGFMSRYSRSGKVLYATNFCPDFNLWLTIGHANAVWKPTQDDGFLVPGCLLLDNNTPPAGEYYVYRYFPAIFDTVFGIEYSYKAMSNTAIQSGIKFQVHDGIDNVIYSIRLDYSAGKVYGFSTGGTYADLADLDVNNKSNVAFGIVKLYVDITNRKWKRLQVQGRDIPLNDIPPYVNAGGISDTDILLGFTVYSAGAYGQDCKFGHMVLTFGE